MSGDGDRWTLLLRDAASLNVMSQGGRNWTFQPTVLLWHVARARTHPGTRLWHYADVEPDLERALRVAGHATGTNTLAYPWKALVGSALWDVPHWAVLNGPTSAGGIRGKGRARGVNGVDGAGNVKVGAAREHPLAVAGLTVDAFAMAQEPVGSSLLSGLLLHRWWPTTIHDVVLEVCDPLRALGPAAASVLGEWLPAGDAEMLDDEGRTRSPSFRPDVIDSWGALCGMCGIGGVLAAADRRDRVDAAGLDAAHVHGHKAGGPDTPDNGVVLCTTHHRLFDLGAFTLESDDGVDVAVRTSPLWTPTDPRKDLLMVARGTRLTLVSVPKVGLDIERLAWHQDNVFRAG